MGVGVDEAAANPLFFAAVAEEVAGLEAGIVRGREREKQSGAAEETEGVEEPGGTAGLQAVEGTDWAEEVEEAEEAENMPEQNSKVRPFLARHLHRSAWCASLDPAATLVLSTALWHRESHLR